MQTETWRNAPSYNQLQVSDKGRVRNTATGKLRKLTRAGRYLVIRVERQTVRVHTLVATTFLGTQPDGYHICHNDGDGTNNLPSNLRYDTPQGNMHDKYQHGTNRCGEAAWCSKLTEADILAIRREYMPRKTTYKQLAKKYGVTQSHIGGIVKRRFWAHLADDGSHLPQEEWEAQYNTVDNNYRRRQRLVVDGKKLTIKEWAAHSKLPVHVIRQRLKAGWTATAAVTTPKSIRGQKITAFGKALTFSQWAEETGIPEKNLRNRITLLGWDPERALTVS